MRCVPHAPKAYITDDVCITHAVRITFRKERITQKSLFCPVDKRDFFVGGEKGIRTPDRVTPIHDFQSCAFDQLGHLSVADCSTLDYYTLFRFQLQEVFVKKKCIFAKYALSRSLLIFYLKYDIITKNS